MDNNMHRLPIVNNKYRLKEIVTNGDYEVTISIYKTYEEAVKHPYPKYARTFYIQFPDREAAVKHLEDCYLMSLFNNKERKNKSIGE